VLVPKKIFYMCVIYRETDFSVKGIEKMASSSSSSDEERRTVSQDKVR